MICVCYAFYIVGTQKIYLQHEDKQDGNRCTLCGCWL